MTKAQIENKKRFIAVQAEAKKLKAKNPKLAHTEAVKQAWAILLHKPASKIGAVKKVVAKNQSIAGIFSFAGFKFRDVRQFDIYNHLSYIIEDENGKKLFIISGDTKRIPSIVNLLINNIKYNSGLTENEIKSYIIPAKKFITLLNKEVNDYNKGKITKLPPAKELVPIIKTPIKKIAIKKAVAKKPPVKKTLTRQTGTSNTALDKLRQALPAGKRIAKDTGNVYYERRANRSDKGKLLGIGAVKKPAVAKHKDTNSHNVNIRVMSGLPNYKNAVRVYFDDPKYNYTTDVGINVTPESAKSYFVGKYFNVGVYPKEILKKCTRIKFFQYINK